MFVGAEVERHGPGAGLHNVQANVEHPQREHRDGDGAHAMRRRVAKPNADLQRVAKHQHAEHAEKRAGHYERSAAAEARLRLIAQQADNRLHN